MLLTLSRYQMISEVFYVILCAKITYKGYFVIQ